ncbi:substrate-binding periplasmic protein [Aeromonas cavernicola]|uniref:Amino acid ABC transporter substrate-binding protein n=1 Tax=Aeromonas cavernicola TaxID=1006623 RepID=A0A2H9U668_9GAMM|nr:transporter substrate-binding domain-containing protein [Aeromonas cavernicola]PJG59501.1 amino acid ABC transporter substrate-binding protein [Aeromonas cavernicola]
MKRLFCGLLFVLSVPHAISGSLCPVPLQIGFDNWPPYHYYRADSRQPVQGVAVETLNAVLAKLGCHAHYVELPWRRVLHEIELGKLDVAMEVSFNNDRARYARFSESYNPGMTTLWTRKEYPNGKKELASWLASGNILGVTKDYVYADDVIALLSRYAEQVSVVNSDRQNYGKLMLGRIDGFLGDMLATSWGVMNEGLSGQIVPHKMVIYELPTHFLFSKRHFSLEFMRQFDHALATFKTTPEYQRIWQRYSLTKVNG